MKSDGIRWFLGLLLALFSSMPLTVEASPEPLNILFIAVDDLKPILGCYRDEQVVTPQIDRLAAAGTVFLNNHCQQSVCAPSRVSLLTGMRPDYTQVWDLKTQMRDRVPDILTLPQYLKQHGYATAATGKILDYRAVDKGHDSISWSVPYVQAGGKQWFNQQNNISTQSVDLPDEEFTDGKIAAVGMELMSQLADKHEPFFLAVGFKKPHLPFVAPQRDWDLYQREDFSPHPIPEFAQGTPSFAYQPGWELRSYDDILAEGPIPDQQQIELIHGYYACVSFIDRQVGKLLDHLESLNLRDKTVIVLWGDHGWHLGDHSLWCKHTNFEQATRSPLIVAYPQATGGQVSMSPTEFVDVFPTLCELAGVPIPDTVQGQSLVPILEDPNQSVKDFAISQYPRSQSGTQMMGYALRTQQYRYVEWITGYTSTLPYLDSLVVARELYDYYNDPHETINLVSDPQYSNTVNELADQLQNFFASQMDPKYNNPNQHDPSNLLLNPSFDFGTLGWAGNQCRIEVIAEDVIAEREYIMHVTDRSKNWTALRQDITKQLNQHGPGSYFLSGFLRSEADPSLDMKLQISLTANGKTVYRLAQKKKISPHEWTQLQGTVTLAWQGTVENASFYLPSVSELGSYFVDDCTIRFEPIQTPIR